MADFVDDLNLAAQKPSDSGNKPSGFIDDLDLVEKPSKSLWERAKSFVGLNEEPKREMTVQMAEPAKPQETTQTTPQPQAAQRTMTVTPVETPAGPLTRALNLLGESVVNQSKLDLATSENLTYLALPKQAAKPILNPRRIPETLVGIHDKELSLRQGSERDWIPVLQAAPKQEENPSIIQNIAHGFGIDEALGMDAETASAKRAKADRAKAAVELVGGKIAPQPLEQFAGNFINAAGFGLPKAISEARGDDYFKSPEGAAEKTSVGLGELGGIIAGGPGKIAMLVGEGVLKIAPKAAITGAENMASRVAKGVVRDASALGSMSASSAIGEALTQDNLDDAFRVVKDAAKSGALMGVTFAGAKGFSPGKSPIDRIKRIATGTALFDLQRDDNPFDDRQLNEKIVGYGLDIFFLWHGIPDKTKAMQVLKEMESSSKVDVAEIRRLWKSGDPKTREELLKKYAGKEERPVETFVDDLNIASKDEVKINPSIKIEEPKSDLSGRQESEGERAPSGTKKIIEAKETPLAEPKRLIDDILKDLDEVQGQQAEIEKAKDAGIAVSPEKEVAVEQKADDLKAELVETVKEESQQPKDVKPIVKEALQKPTPIPTKEAIATKAQTKQTLEAGLKTGDIAADTPVRLTSVDELRSIIKNGRLFVGKDAEGHDVISAQKIKQDVPIVGYGANNKISAAIIFESSHIEGKGMAPNEVSIHPKTEVSKLMFVVDGHDKILTFDEIKEIYKGGQEQNPSEETKEVVPAKLPVELSKSNPRYSYREKQFQIEFPDDVTKAAYIVRNSKKLSAKDAGFMSFLRSQYPEKTDEQIRALGESIKSDLTTQAKTAKHNTTLKVNSIIQEKENVDPAGQSDKIETDEVDFYDRPDSKKILDEAGTEGHEAADIAAKTTPQAEAGLIEEAKKYKTAEDFINDKLFYHGSETKNVDFKKALNEYGSYKSENKGYVTQTEGVYLTKSNKIAKGYGHVGEYVVDVKNPFVGDVHDFYKTRADEALETFNEEYSTKYKTWEEAFKKEGDLSFEEKISDLFTEATDESGIDHRAILFGGLPKGYYGQLKFNFDRSLITYDFKNAGYDAQNDIVASKDKQFIVFDPDNIKPINKKQLTDIWNKAHELPNPSRPPEVGGQSVKTPISETKPPLPKPHEDSISGEVEAAGAKEPWQVIRERLVKLRDDLSRQADEQNKQDPLFPSAEYSPEVERIKDTIESGDIVDREADILKGSAQAKMEEIHHDRMAEVLKDYPELAKEAKSAAPEAKESLKRQEYDIIGNPAEDSVIAKAFDLYKKTYGMDSLVIEPVTAPSGKAMFQISAKYPNGNVDGIGTRDDSREVLRSRMINILNSPVAGKARDIGVDVGKTWVEVAADVNEARADKVTQDKMRKEYNQEQYIRRAFRETSDKLTELKIRKKDGLPVDEATIEKAQSAFDKAAKRYNDFYRDSKQSTANTTKAKPVTAEPKANKVIPATKTAEKNVVTPKEQKKYLLEKIDEALKVAPDEQPTGSQYSKGSHKYASAARLEEMRKEDVAAFAADKEKFGVVVIEVPNDGTFTILNTKTSLENFKKQTSKFPASVIKGAELKTPMPSKRETGKRLELEGVSYYNDFKPRKQDIIPSGDDKHNYYVDGYFTQGHYLVKTERPKGIKISEETKDVKKVIPKDKDLITAEIIAEYNYGGGERETAKVHIVAKDGTEYAVNAHYVDVILTKHPNATVFVKKDTAISPIVFKDVKEVVGVTMPLKDEIPSAEFIAEHQVDTEQVTPKNEDLFGAVEKNDEPKAEWEVGKHWSGDDEWRLNGTPWQIQKMKGTGHPFVVHFNGEGIEDFRTLTEAKAAVLAEEEAGRPSIKPFQQATPKTETQQPRTWFELGRIVSDKYSNLARGKSTSLKPDDVTLKQVSSEIGITNEDARRALTVYNSSEPREREKNISKPVPKIADTDKSKQKPEAKEPWQMTLDELASQKTNWYAGKQYLIPRDKFIEVGIARNYEKRDDGYYGFNYDNNKEYRVDEKILNNMREESAKSHKYYVQKARKEGKEIPEAVLKDYPELKKEEAEKKPNNAGTDDSGAELTYNKRNRIRTGIKWTDIQDKNTALKVKEVTKSNVYPKPDYQQMVADGMHPMSAYLVKTVYDSIPPTPVIGSRTITDEDMQRYITAVNRVMEGTMSWANDKEALASWASKQASFAGGMLGKTINITDLAKSGKPPLDAVYPDGYKNYIEEVRILGGRSMIKGLQPGYDQVKKAAADLKKGWPGKIESWQRQGFAVIERKDIKVPAGWTDSNGKPVYMTEINGRTFGERYSSKEDAQAAIDQIQPFILVDRYNRPVSEHDSLEEAQEAAREKVKHKGGKTINEKGISVESAERVGETRRKEGENITSDRLRETFGFKGVNFGNWMKGNANEAERQLHLNHAYDSFMDLAELLNVPPEALSLNGMLGVAIGAQGSGAAAAHFVPGVNEINLTRTAGAGAIAHEWAHALDHYFGTQAGLSAAKHPYLTENKPIGGTIRPDIVTLFDKIVHAINFKTITITPEEQAQQEAGRKQIAKDRVASWLKSIRRDYANNGIDEQAFDAIANRIRNMELGDGRVSVSGYFSMSPAVSELRNLYKEKTGRTYSLDQIKGLQTNIDHYKYLSEKDQTAHVPQTRETYSDYALEAGRLDKGKKKDYWNTNREKFARAFDAFITDSISEKEAKNTYLSGIEAAPPKGEERKTINQAFRELVDEIKTRETENGLMLFDNKGNYDIIKAKKAGLVDDETIQRIENYGNEISTSKRGNLDSTVRASKIPADFTKQGFVDLRGQRIESPRDLAAICQIFRDPQVETLRYFYLKDGVIVGHEGISSRMPGFASFFPTGQFAKNIMKMIGRARRLKADEIYMLHNHPSGVPKPSDEDMRATATLSGNLYLKSKEDGRGTIKLSTHVIIDHKKYGVITPKLSFGKKGNIEGISVNRYISDLPEGKEYGPPSVPHELLGAKIADQDDLVNIGKLVKSPKNYATLIFRDGNGKVSGIQDVHVGMLKGKDADGYLRALARDFGAHNIFAHVLDIEEIGESRVRELIKNGSLLDVSWGNKAASESGMRKRLGYVFGKKISDYGSMRVHEWSNVENLTENQREARKRIERNLSIMGDEAQKAGVSIEDYMKATGMSEGQVTRLMEYAKAQPVEAPEGYREVLPDEVLPAGSDVNMDFISGKSFVKVKDTTGVKHAAIEEERVKAGKEPVIKQEPRGNEGMFQAAKAAVDSGEIKPRLLAQEVAKKPRPITTEEEFALMYDRMRIKNELRDIQRQIDTAQQDKNSQMEADLLERRTAIESDLDTNDQATTHGGSEVGRSLQARTRMINEDYSLEEILLRARQDNGGTLSEEMRKKYEALAREIEEANEKIKAYEEKIASLEAKRSFQRMKNDDVIIRHLGQAKEKRASAKKALDDEFSQLTKQLNAALGGIHMNFDPTAVKILALMAKNRIKAGILTPDGIVNEIYEQVHESYPEVEKRDIRDAISGYGRTLQLSKDEIDVQLREAKRLMRLISSYEDASSGQVPLRSGMQRDKMTNEVRELGRRVRQAMREAGIDWESSLSPEEQWKTSLDAVKTRLRNQIHDIKQQIETGEKSPKKIGIKYDEEAEALRAQRDKLKDILISIEGKPGMSPEQKINLAMAAVEKSIAEYERRISEKDLAPKKQGTGSPETPELKSLRDRRDELRAIYKEMQKEAKPKKTPEEIALQSYKTRMKNRIKELEEKLEKKDFAEKPKRELRLDDEGLTLKHNLDRAISRLNEARLKDQLARRNWLQKFIGGTAETANFMRSVKASMDVSAVFRQGLFTVVSHPVVGAKALPAMFNAFKNDKYRFAVEQDILNRPNYKLYKDAGLDLTDIGTDLSKMEETFMSRLAEKIPGVAGSQRAYTTFLNKIRVDTFDLLIKNLVKSEGKHTPEEAKAIATLINESTGRGKVGMKPNTLSGLNTIFFAPRLVASRFQILAGHSMWKGTKASRKLIAKEYGRFLAGMSVVYLLAQLAGFDIEWDPRSSDFGKIKIGNTRIDPMGGFAQVIVFSSRVISGKTKSSSGVIKPIRGDVQYGQGNTADVIWRFLRTKLAPAVSVSIDALTGTDVVGNKVTVFNPDELKAPETVTDIPKQIGKVSSLPEKTVAPMAIVDTYEAMRDRGIPQGLAIGALGMLGVGIQTYEKDTKQKLKDDLRDAIKSEDQEAIDTAKEAISDASDNELITERDKKRILKDAKDDAFVSAAKKMPLPALAEMIKEDATDDQKEALHDIFKKKIDRARQERRIDSETQDRYYEILEEMR